jgi:hypothetical protein
MVLLLTESHRDLWKLCDRFFVNVVDASAEGILQSEGISMIPLFNRAHRKACDSSIQTKQKARPYDKDGLCMTRNSGRYLD